MPHFTPTKKISRFNGAAPGKARKHQDTIAHDALAMLQWGRAGEGAEGHILVLSSLDGVMLQWGRAGEGAEGIA